MPLSMRGTENNNPRLSAIGSRLTAITGTRRPKRERRLSEIEPIRDRRPRRARARGTSRARERAESPHTFVT
jgi:hypothetical protein